MKIKIIYILTVTILSITFTSCSKWLDVKPQKQVEREALYSSEEGFKSALTGCYIKLKNTYSKDMTMTTLEFMAHHWAASPNNKDLKEKLMKFEYEDDLVKMKMKTIYGDIFNIVSQLNDLLVYIDKSNDAIFSSVKIKKMIKGEALAMRAFLHFDILRLFGQLPQGGTEKVSLPYIEIASKENAPYYDFDAYVGKVLKDFTDAENLLRESDLLIHLSYAATNSPASLIENKWIDSDFEAFRRVRFNYYAVKGLQARVYMYVGEYNKAYTKAMEVINAKVGDEKPVNSEVADSNGTPEPSSSVIQLNGTEDIGGGFYTLPSETLLSINYFKITEIVDDMFIDDYAELFAPCALVADEEHENSILKDVFHYESLHNRYKLWIAYSSSTGLKSASILKYHQPEDESAAEDYPTKQAVIPLLRFSELFLVAMEALAESGDDLTTINLLMDEYRNMRNLDKKIFDSKEDVKTEVFREYRREFWAEGQMFFTYKRLYKKDMLWRVEPMEEKNYIVPLPGTEYQ